VQKIEELLQRSGARIERETDRLKILSPVSNFSHEFDFDCEGDPRLAMAAAILLKKEIPVNIKNRQIVNKSFPDFWDILNV
ncbi:MAG: hypothetical protein KDD50_01295, partial [Bdellovibrionales bacterium]|nr:hypothetical protein [Bdellovibrionales bacterium]